MVGSETVGWKGGPVAARRRTERKEYWKAGRTIGRGSAVIAVSRLVDCGHARFRSSYSLLLIDMTTAADV